LCQGFWLFLRAAIEGDFEESPDEDFTQFVEERQGGRAVGAQEDDVVV
jgi:hypothetical protein